MYSSQKEADILFEVYKDSRTVFRISDIAKSSVIKNFYRTVVKKNMYICASEHTHTLRLFSTPSLLLFDNFLITNHLQLIILTY